MRLIVLIRSFNPRRTQFILQDIETRGKSFNPRAHTGRESARTPRSAGTPVSIHAPTRGAIGEMADQFRAFVFQSTRPHGARTFNGRHTEARVCFNPRAHTGRDFLAHKIRGAVAVSIHAPTRGAITYRCWSITSATFQSTRPHGARSIFSKRLNICIQNYTFCETWQTYTQNCFY